MVLGGPAHPRGWRRAQSGRARHGVSDRRVGSSLFGASHRRFEFVAVDDMTYGFKTQLGTLASMLRL